MRILYFTDVFPPHCGGSGWSVYYFAKALRDRGHEIDIVSLSGNSGRYDGLEVSAYATAPADIPFFANWQRYRKELPEIARSIKSRFPRYDILHAHHKLSAIALAMAEPEQPFLVTLRDYWPICICGRSQFRTGDSCSVYDFGKCSDAENTWKGLAAPVVYPFLEERMRRSRALLRNADRIFCISNYLRNQMLPFFPADKLTVLPNFAEEVPLKEVTGLPDRFCIYIGRLESNKGAHLLPEIMQKSETNLPLVIVGEGSLQTQMQEDCAKRNVTAHFVGYKEHAEMLSILNRASFVLFPSVWPEPLGRVLIEAGMMSKASICFSHAGGHHDVIQHQVNGWMAGSAEEFATAVAEFAQNQTLCNRLGSDARTIYEQKFNANAVIPKLLEYYPERHLYTRLAMRGATAPQPRLE